MSIMPKPYHLFLLLASFFTTQAFAQPVPSSAPLNIVESDSSPSCYPYKLVVSNGSLSCPNANTVATLTTSGGGGGSPGSPDLSIQTNVSGTFTGSSKLLFDESGPTLFVGDGTGEFDVVTPAGSGSAFRFQSNESQIPYLLLDAADGDSKNSISLGFISAADTDTNGGSISFGANDGNGVAQGGDIFGQAGQGGTNDGTGGNVQFNSGLAFGNGSAGNVLFLAGSMSGAGNGFGGSATFQAGNGNFAGGVGTGGDVRFIVGKGFGGGSDGLLKFETSSTSKGVDIDLSVLSAVRAITYADQDGVIYNLPDAGANTLAGWDDTDNKPTNITIGSGLTYTHGSHTISAAGSSTGGWQEDTTNHKVYLVNSGNNVGIGTSTPTKTLDINGTANFSTSINTPAIANLTSNGFVKTSGGTGTLNVDTNSYIQSIADPNANRLFGWDDTDNDYKFFTMGANLSYDHTTHTLSAGTTGVAIPIKEDGIAVSTAGIFNFIEPDTTLVTDSPSGTARIDTSKYAILGGRSGGQTIIGTTGSGTNQLNFDLNSSGVVGGGSINVGNNITSATGGFDLFKSTPTVSINLDNRLSGLFGGFVYQPTLNLDSIYPTASPGPGLFYQYLFLAGGTINSNGVDAAISISATNAQTTNYFGDTGQLEIGYQIFDLHEPNLAGINGGTILVDNMFLALSRPSVFDDVTITKRYGLDLADLGFNGTGSSVGDFIGMYIESMTVTGDVTGIKLEGAAQATHVYGLYMGDSTGVTGAGNSYSIYSLGGNILYNEGAITSLNTITAKQFDMTGATSGTVSLKSDTGTWTLTLPVDDGIPGQFLQTNGSGVSSWANAGAIIASNDLTGQNAAVSSIVTTTVPNDGSNHTYSVGGYVTVTAISVNTITLQVDYTDETNTSRTQSFFGEGLTTAAISTTGGFAFPPMTLRCKANTSITMKTTIVGIGSETYDVGGYCMKIN